MLQSKPTKGGTGLIIFGTFGDLYALHELTHRIAGSLNEYHEYSKGQHELLMNFAYEVRKAYDGNREKVKASFIGDEFEYMFYGFKCVWTDVLIFISALRDNVGYIQSSRKDQAILYMLEFVVEEAMFEYDPVGANLLKGKIDGISVANKYCFIIYQALHIKFVSMKCGKTRFRAIPTLLRNHFSSFTKEYKDLILSFKTSAIENGYEVLDLEFSDFPEIKW